MSWAVILHGGAKTIKQEDRAANRAGCLEALAAARAVLSANGHAVDAVEAAVRQLEDDPTFNAGAGSEPNSEGDIEMCAALMEGRDLNVGAVGAIRAVRHPISVARLMLPQQPILMVAEGARAFARDHGAELCELSDLKVGREPTEGRHDTVGCIALDNNGLLAVATSTGGLGGTPPGRVGDSPQPGCGFYADNARGAVAFSGDGESIARLTLAARVMEALASQSPRDAVTGAMSNLTRIGGEAGGIALNRHGQMGWDHSSDHFAVAWMSTDHSKPQVRLSKFEDH
jgi:beta-aspartyl-peptidase (threonine type)